jgi:hypothetical protein
MQQIESKSFPSGKVEDLSDALENSQAPKPQPKAATKPEALSLNQSQEEQPEEISMTTQNQATSPEMKELAEKI